LAETLADRARAGVRVKILLDAIGSADIGDDIVRTLRTADASLRGTTRSGGTRLAASTTGPTGSR